jgi:hypothetical protein
MDYVLDNLSVPVERLYNNTIKSFEGMTTQRWVRLVAIIGGYMLLRPWLLKFAADRQKKQFEKESEDLGLGGPTANDLRGGKGTTATTAPAAGGAPAGAGKVLGEVKDEAPKAPRKRPVKAKGGQKKMLEEEEADEEREIRQFLDEQRSGLTS